MNRNKKDSDAGFTVVEVVVTLVITSIFLAFFFQMYLMGESQRVTLARQATASNIAYANLRKISDRSDVEGVMTACNSNNNLTANPSAAGTDITSLITPEATGNLDGTVTQVVRAYYPRGCATPNMPIKIEAITSYGSPVERVIHASYIN